ncbi:hypothetical protein RB213_015295, partial [Colletotrichum asianum]
MPLQLMHRLVQLFPLLRKQTCTTMRQNKKAPYFAQICRPCLHSVPMRKRDIHGSTPPFLLSPWAPLGTE